MSIANAPTQSTRVPSRTLSSTTDHLTPTSDTDFLDQILESVSNTIAPVWPLQDYVAVNPYAGMSCQDFLAARKTLRSVSDLETLMPVDYYRQQYADGLLSKSDIDAAVDELVADGVQGAERIDINQVISLLLEASDPSPTADSHFEKCGDSSRPLRPLVELFDRHSGTQWSRTIREEISKHCSAHYDRGQAVWVNPWRDLPLYDAWRAAAKHDRSFEILGVSDFRQWVAGLPPQPKDALITLLSKLRIPPESWHDVLVSESLAMPGWSAWTRYQKRDAELRGEVNEDFEGLLAMRLAYEVALTQHQRFEVNWACMAATHEAFVRETAASTDEDLLRYALHKATEIAFRGPLLASLTPGHEQTSGEVAKGSLAQVVFCIDVRSERIRRNLEAMTPGIETFGFAGFFGAPMEYVPLGHAEGTAQVPVLISPQFCVHEEIDDVDYTTTEQAIQQRLLVRFRRKAWKEFQSSAVSCFAFVEATGLFYGLKLIARSLGWSSSNDERLDGIGKKKQHRLGPSLRGLSQQGITTSKQVDMAESILRGIGIVDNFARLVVFCGHGSQTENNPLQAGLDCGACGGHSGEANARFAAKLLNQSYIRQALDERGISIPDSTIFVAALHNTTTDDLTLFDAHAIPASHNKDIQTLEDCAVTASRNTRTERLTVLPGKDDGDLKRRSRDWSEIRPEWGLAGNAAFVAAPRALTKSISLEGRSFLHSYDHRNDPQYAVLEQILTAPMVVAHWINMQYYASTVDPIHFGSGNKAVHNVVGQFGILSGNGGDLMTGLPWQSVHDGCSYQHHPLRLLAVIAAPMDAIEAILDRHEDVHNLLINGWLQLVAIDEGRFYRYTQQQTWDEAAASDFSSPRGATLSETHSH